MNDPTPDPCATSPTRPQHILVVEDDPAVRNTEAALLHASGYDVEVAEDGEAGWRLLHERHFDLLITDFQMPRLSGMDLIWRLNSAGISLPVIMTSGTACMEIINPSREPAPWFKAFLHKPFRPRELIDVVNHVLGNGEPMAPNRVAEYDPYAPSHAI